MAEDNNTPENEELNSDSGQSATETDISFGSHLNRMMTVNFMEFASYVIKDRAIPDIDDGLKP